LLPHRRAAVLLAPRAAEFGPKKARRSRSISFRDFDVSPDGTRFAMMRNDDPRTTERLHVLLNWPRLIEARLPPALR